MIFDKIENLRQYDVVSDKILEFLFNLNENTPVGRYTIDDKVYASVAEYNTKSHENCFFEAHKRYIDIQLLLKGEERLDFRHIDCLTVKEDYNEDKDIIFYTDTETLGSVKLIPDYFAMLYPQDAHRPQMNSTSESQCVKKVVIKILAA